MFKSLVSALSLSPHAASQLTFYAKRLSQEKITRRFSAIGAVLIIALQFATIAAPPANVNAASPNDIIYGGYVSKNDLLNKYDSSSELKALYTYFGITRQDIVGSTQATINTRDRSLMSMGRDQHWADDQPIKVGASTYWGRYLYKWDTGADIAAGSDYKVLQGHTASGAYFGIIFGCGNLVFHSIPQPTPAPTPKPTPVPTPVKTATPTPTPIKTPTPTPTPKVTPKPTPTPAATLACTELTGNIKTGTMPLTVAYTGTGAATGQTLTKYNFDYGDHAVSSGSSRTANHTYTTAGTFTATLTVTGSLGSTTPIVAPCTYTITVTPPPAAFTKHKTALNLTQNIDATKKAANPSDRIQYTLTTTNTGGVGESYVVVEHLEDILEYADVTDAGGGLLDAKTGVMTWDAANIGPGQTLSRTFIVTVKSPVPSTPAGSSDPTSFDLRMDNVYGNAVQVHVTPPVPKQVETAAAQLPDTGAPLATTIVLIFSALAIFFYFRNRQLANEIRLLRNDYHGGV